MDENLNQFHFQMIQKAIRGRENVSSSTNRELDERLYDIPMSRLHGLPTVSKVADNLYYETVSYDNHACTALYDDVMYPNNVSLPTVPLGPLEVNPHCPPSQLDTKSERHSWPKYAFTVAVIIVLIIGTATTVSLLLHFHSDSKYKQLSTSSKNVSLDVIHVDGRMSITGGPFSIFKPSLLDQNSHDFIALSTIFISQIELVFKSSSIVNLYEGTNIKYLRKGSVVVNYVISLSRDETLKNENDARMKVDNILRVSVVENSEGRTFLGSLEVDYLGLHDLVVNTTKSVPSGLETTTKDLVSEQTIPTTISIDTATKFNTIPYPTKSDNCHPVLIQKCRNILPYETSIQPRQVQNQLIMNSTLNSMVLHFGDCYKHVELFLCGTLLPPCGLASSLLPCRQMCYDFKTACSEKLNDVPGLGNVFDCEGNNFPTDTSKISMCIRNETSAIQNTTDVARCTPLYTKYCSNLPYNISSSPNLFMYYKQEDIYSALRDVSIVNKNSHCHRLLQNFVCFTMYPQCVDSRIVPPCRDICQDIVQNCSRWLQLFNINIPFQCDKFPGQDSCVNEEQMKNMEITFRSHECSASNEFSCGPGQCVPLSDRCDQVSDCANSLDEQNCGDFKCVDGQFECSHGDCIPQQWHCDGVQDCKYDSSDENNCSSEATVPNDRTTTIMYATKSYECQPITGSNICLHDQGWNMTIFPNFLGHQSQEEATHFIHLIEAVHTVYTCYDYLHIFGCSILVPPCSHVGTPLPPCGKLCQEATEGCQQYLDFVGIPKFNCTQFPDSDDPLICVKKPDIQSEALRCQSDQFDCEDGTCVNMLDRCDSAVDCRNTRDEQECGNYTCIVGQFTCLNKNCRPMEWVCDNEDDCGDNSDEASCH